MESEGTEALTRAVIRKNERIYLFQRCSGRCIIITLHKSSNKKQRKNAFNNLNVVRVGVLTLYKSSNKKERKHLFIPTLFGSVHITLHKRVMRKKESIYLFQRCPGRCIWHWSDPRQFQMGTCTPCMWNTAHKDPRCHTGCICCHCSVDSSSRSHS